MQDKGDLVDNAPFNIYIQYWLANCSSSDSLFLMMSQTVLKTCRIKKVWYGIIKLNLFSIPVNVVCVTVQNHITIMNHNRIQTTQFHFYCVCKSIMIYNCAYYQLHAMCVFIFRSSIAPLKNSYPVFLQPCYIQNMYYMKRAIRVG
jgi:hypothetical protein